MKWVKSSDRLPKINKELIFNEGWFSSNEDFIKMNGSRTEGQFIQPPDGEVYFSYPAHYGGNPYTKSKEEFDQIYWLDETIDDEEYIIDKIVAELPSYGVDTSEWAEKYGEKLESVSDLISKVLKDIPMWKNKELEKLEKELKDVMSNMTDFTPSYLYKELYHQSEDLRKKIKDLRT